MRDKLSKVWNLIPDGVQIIIYVCVAGLLVQFSNDVLAYGADNNYVALILTGLANAALFYANILKSKDN